MAAYLDAAGSRSGRRWPKLAASRDIAPRRADALQEWAVEPDTRSAADDRATSLRRLPKRILIAAIHVAVGMMLVAGFPDLVPNLQAGLQRTLHMPLAGEAQEAEGAQTSPVSQAQPGQVVVAAASQPEAAIAGHPVPDVNGMVILIRTTLAALDQANRTDNYSVLREIAAPKFQEANSAARLSEVFGDLRGRNVDLAPLAVINPRLVSEPAFDGNGMLRLTGVFPSRPLQVNFDLAFQPLDGRWRLFGVAVDAVPNVTAQEGDAGPPIEVRPPASTEPARQPALPDPVTMASLIRNAVMALNQANMTGNYSMVREISAPGFQQANSHAQLSEIFAALRARDLDLGPVAVIAPELFRPPAIDERGMLRLTGFFRSEPEQVNFDLAFQLFGKEWRLFGIGLNTSRIDQAAPASKPPPAIPHAPGPPPLPRPRPGIE